MCGIDDMFFRNKKPMLVWCRESEQPGGHSNFPFLAMTTAQANCWFFFSFFKSHQSCAKLVSTCLLPMRSNHLYHHVNATAHSCTLASLRLSHSGAAETRSGTTVASKSVVERPVRHSGVLSRTWRSTSRQFSTEKWFLGCRDVADQSF